ncbi:MAG TPA: pyrroloquinoline quinone biosynthesis protein PqqE [Bryobacteraceae bacterium]|nr:pyrroloquinoline quinone biosynthesis protein PqqE [Bryobacteraceae bacterium]
MAGPLSLIAEITHRCPLHCVYCSNPREMQARERELDTETWAGVFAQAAELGVLQLHLTGGEPLARTDLAELVAAARQANLYVNLITSGIGLAFERLDALVAAGADHIQLSFQDADPDAANEFAGARAHQHKHELARLIKQRPVAFTVNMVVHRRNLDRLEQMIALAEELEAERLEIAHVQYYGWALCNREALLPTRQQWERSLAVVTAARERLAGRMRIDFVAPDYYAKYPKPCMGGWGRGTMLIDPAGRALPCHAAGTITGLAFENVRERPLRWIWEESAAFQKFRGEEWMQEPCRSCERRALDFGGCRCQALAIAGDARATDPVCTLSPMRGLVDAMVERVNGPQVEAASGGWVYRVDPPKA